jgi:hypothetical protein
MQPHLQRIEGEPPVDLDDQLAVEDEPLRSECTQHRRDLRNYRPSGLPDLAQSDAFRALKVRHRKPFHFGSYCQAPAIPESRSADFASIGAVSNGSGKSPTCSGVVAGLQEEAASPSGGRRATMIQFLLQLLGRCIELHAVVADRGDEFTRLFGGGSVLPREIAGLVALAAGRCQLAAVVQLVATIFSRPRQKASV